MAEPADTVDFLNNALGRAGYNQITAVGDGSREANSCNLFYPRLRKSLISLARWRFSERRAALTAGPTPAFEFAYSYLLPTDFVRIWEYNGAVVTAVAVDPLYWMAWQGRYKIEGPFSVGGSNVLLSNDGEVKIVYGFDQALVAQWNSLFFETLADWLASFLASDIGKDTNKAQMFYSRALSHGLPLASGVDTQQGTVNPQQSSELLWGR